MINHISKFCLLFIFIILFLSFKNQIKILENDLIILKKNYERLGYFKFEYEYIELITKIIEKLDKITIKGIKYLLDKEGIMNIYTNNKLIKNLLLDYDGTPIGVYKNKKVIPLEF